MHLSVRSKHWFFAHYWWIMIIAAFVIFALMANFNEPLASFVAVAGALLSLVYFVQKQRLEEIRLFRDIFQECNKRYDVMNEKLADLRNSHEPKLSSDETKLLLDYFNLCGEEYLYYRQGYIPVPVWEAWFKGMKDVLRSPRVNDLWQSEATTGTYYDLPLEG